MDTQALVLVLLAGLVHAGWNIVAKKVGGDFRFAFFTSFILMIVWAPLAWWIGHAVVPYWGAQEWLLIAASGALHLIYYVTLLRGYRVADLTVVYPLARGTGPLLSATVALVWWGEAISRWGLAGIAAVVGGVFLIAGGPAMLRRRVQAAEARLRLRRGLWYGILTGTFIASYTLVDGYGVRVLLLSPILIDYMGNFVRIGLLLPAVLRDRGTAWQMWRQQWRWAAVVAVVSPVAYVMVLFAMQTAPLSLVAPAREVSMLFAALLGGHLLQEGDRWQRMMGAVLIAAGVAAISLG